MRLVPHYRNVSLESGSLMHEMLELHYNLVKAQELPLGEIIREAVDHGRRLTIEQDLSPSDSESMVKAYQEYAMFYKDDQWEPLYVEQKFSKVLYERQDEIDLECCEPEKSCPEHEGLTILLEGKIDLIAHHRVHNQTYIWDHKTTSRASTPVKLSNQFAAYCWATGVNQAILNQIGLQKTLASNEKYKRHMISYSDAALKEWRDNAIWWCNLLDQFLKHQSFPMNWTACTKFGKPCPYLDICQAHPEARQSKISQGFIQVQHDLFEVEND